MIELGNDIHGHHIARATNAVYNPGAETVISRSEEGRLFGGVIFSCYTGTSLCIDVAGFRPHWCNRNLLWMTFNYAFGQLRCKVMLGRLHSTNKEAIKFDLHAGFKEVCRIPDAVPNGDLIILAMYRDECRWLNIMPKNLRVYDHLKRVA